MQDLANTIISYLIDFYILTLDIQFIKYSQDKIWRTTILYNQVNFFSFIILITS